jgi:O-antigen/teichoic acid export membrane protein
MDISKQLKSLLNTSTMRHSLVTLFGTGVNGILGLLFYIYSARVLGPENFGLLTVSIAFITLVADIATLGTDTGLIKFIGKYSISDKHKVIKILKLGLEVKLIAFLICLTVGWFLVQYLALNVFNKNELEIPLRLALF